MNYFKLMLISSKMPLAGLINLQTINRSIYKLYIRHYFGKDLELIIEENSDVLKINSVGRQTAHFNTFLQNVTMHDLRWKKRRQGVGYLQKYTHTQTYTALSVTISSFLPLRSKPQAQQTKNQHPTSYQSHKPFYRVNHITVCDFTKGGSNCKTHSDSSLFPS